MMTASISMCMRRKECLPSHGTLAHLLRASETNLSADQGKSL